MWLAIINNNYTCAELIIRLRYGAGRAGGAQSDQRLSLCVEEVEQGRNVLGGEGGVDGPQHDLQLLGSCRQGLRGVLDGVE